MSPRKNPPQHYPEQAPGGWTVERIREAITQKEKGYLAPASRLTRALPRHPRYVQGREQFLGAVQGCPAEVLQSPISYGGVGTARRLRDDAGKMLAHVLRNGAERSLIEWTKVMGLYVGVLAWDTTSRPWTPVSLTRWPLEAVRVDLSARKLWARTTKGEEEIIAGNGTWVVSWAAGEFDFTAGLLSCFGEAWIRGINAARNIANRGQASGVAAIIGLMPEGEDMESDRAVSYQEHLEGLQTGGPAGLLAPPGYPKPESLDLATKNGSSMLELSRNTSTTDLLVPWLMQDGTATNEGGSLAKAKELSGVLFSAVAACVGQTWGEVTADGSHVAGVITSQIVRPWCLLQLGKDVDAEDEESPERRVAADKVCPLAIRRVPDLEEDDRLSAESDRSKAFWGEVGTIEGLMRRDMTEDELGELSAMRGVRIPETVLKERGERPPPTPPAEQGQAFGGA
jgi:hypothetical protein